MKKLGITSIGLMFVLWLLGVVNLSLDIREHIKTNSINAQSSQSSQSSQSVNSTQFVSIPSVPPVLSASPKTTFISLPPMVPPPKDHPPMRIVAGAYSYRVSFTTTQYLHDNDCEAFTSFLTHTIWLDVKENPFDRRETLMHELMHIAVYVNGGPEIGADHNDGLTEGHDIINPAAPALVDILRNNPQLVAWLTER